MVGVVKGCDGYIGVRESAVDGCVWVSCEGEVGELFWDVPILTPFV